MSDVNKAVETIDGCLGFMKNLDNFNMYYGMMSEALNVIKAHVGYAPEQPVAFILKDEAASESWVDTVRKNSYAPYGAATVRFAARWAVLMERRIGEGKNIADVARETCAEADAGEGITGFQYGCAVSILSKVWIHGEMLRLWHNKDIALGTEGERANAQPGAVLNPALLSIRTE